MTPEVKERIEQIRHGIVPEGYKKTGSGIIPNEWRVGQVGECIEEYKVFSNDIVHIPVYSSSRKGLMPQSDYYDQREAVETNLGYKVVPPGYVTYRHMSDDDVFHFNINGTSGDILVSSEYPVFTSTGDCDLGFLIPALNSTARFRYFCKTQKLGGTRTRLYLDNLKRYGLPLPPHSEQYRIAEILATQDKVIELERRKIEEIKKAKRFFLNKMFPKKGQFVPEIRFKGFTDAWEQRKVRDVANRYDNMRVPVAANLRVSGTTPYYGANGIQDYVEGYTHEGEFVLVAEDGANDIKNYPVKCVNGRIWVNNHAHVLQGKAKITDNQFLAYSINQADIESLLVGGSRAKLNAETLMDIELTLPSLPEQQEIGTYLKHLDNLITLHQRKLEEEKKKKKALMQLLLTGIARCEV